MALLTMPIAGQSAAVTYTDRGLFEAALSSFSVDSFDTVPQGQFFTLDRGDYVMAADNQGLFGCINNQACGDNSAKGFDDAYVWDYVSIDTFTFDSQINGFGFDFDSPGNQASVSPILQGITAPTLSGFFGIIDEAAFTQVSLGQTASFMIFDDLTYGVTLPSAVPVPAAVWLFGTALIGLVGFGKRKSKVAA
jgi:hypothetical protein